MSLSKLAKEPVEIEIGGEKWKVSPLTLREVGKIEARLRSIKVSVFLEAACNGSMAPAEKAKRINQLSAMPIDATELQANMSQPAILPLVFCLTLAKHHRDMTEDKAEALIQGMSEDEMNIMAAAMRGMNGQPEPEPGADPTPLASNGDG